MIDDRWEMEDGAGNPAECGGELVIGNR